MGITCLFSDIPQKKSLYDSRPAVSECKTRKLPPYLEIENTAMKFLISQIIGYRLANDQ